MEREEAEAVSQEVFLEALRKVDKAVPAGLTDGTGRPAGRRFAVYRNNVAVSLREALEVGFPAVRSLIGVENFARIAGLYVRHAAPTSPVMAGYGAGFAAMIAQTEALKPIGYLPDVARLEFALRESYHAGDAPPFDPARLQGLSESVLMAATLRLAPSVRLLRSPWPVASVWRFALRGGAKPEARAEDVLILRPAFDPEPHILPPGGADFVMALQQGTTFGAALEAAGADFDLAAMMALLLRGGALADMTTEA
ncbi:putative DNA-binding domain-containing protein [Primorskyibacter sp. 2E107]|uniref:HvfC/BufC family peptide modification chaperone n=1 Tax=Primorskyibacter sp. 2E107 TaxID=3403458 RepID=UPI003AF493E7